MDVDELRKLEWRHDLTIFKNKRRGIALGNRELWAETVSVTNISENESAITIRLIPFRAKYCRVSFPYYGEPT